jgi:hypothetical protein
MKKAVLFLIGFAGSISVNLACNGGVYYYTSEAERTDILAEGSYNCCGGTEITIIDLNDPELSETTIHFNSDGQNSSCG